MDKSRTPFKNEINIDSTCGSSCRLSVEGLVVILIGSVLKPHLLFVMMGSRGLTQVVLVPISWAIDTLFCASKLRF